MAVREPIWEVETYDEAVPGYVFAFLGSESAALAFMRERIAPGRTMRLLGPDGYEIPTPDLAFPTQVVVEVDSQPALFTMPGDSTRSGVPARNKLEAVSRLGRLNGAGPETLGPGSKERKSVLVNLARALHLAVDNALSKPELGGQIAALLGAEWGQDCWSTGSTLTLTGLNNILLAAEREFARRGLSRDEHFESPEAEAEAVLSVLERALPHRFDGRACVEEMREADYSQWAQDEWAGFYFEFKGLPSLVTALGGGPAKYVNTRFDYSLKQVWDLKWHGAAGKDAPLNDCRAIEACLEERGLGFVVLSGEVAYDDGEFREWFKQHRVAHGKTATIRASPASFVRRSKTAFQPRRLEAFYLRDRAALDAGLAQGVLRVLAQGQQVSGAERPPKYRMNLDRARSEFLLAEREVPGEGHRV